MLYIFLSILLKIRGIDLFVLLKYYKTNKKKEGLTVWEM